MTEELDHNTAMSLYKWLTVNNPNAKPDLCAAYQVITSNMRVEFVSHSAGSTYKPHDFGEVMRIVCDEVFDCFPNRVLKLGRSLMSILALDARADILEISKGLIADAAELEKIARMRPAWMLELLTLTATGDGRVTAENKSDWLLICKKAFDQIATVDIALANRGAWESLWVSLASCTNEGGVQAVLEKLGDTNEHTESIGEEHAEEDKTPSSDARPAGNAAGPGDAQATAADDGAADGSAAESPAAAPAPKRQRLREPTPAALANGPVGFTSIAEKQSVGIDESRVVQAFMHKLSAFVSCIALNGDNEQTIPPEAKINKIGFLDDDAALVGKCPLDASLVLHFSGAVSRIPLKNSLPLCQAFDTDFFINPPALSAVDSPA